MIITNLINQKQVQTGKHSHLTGRRRPGDLIANS